MNHHIHWLESKNTQNKCWWNLYDTKLSTNTNKDNYPYELDWWKNMKQQNQHTHQHNDQHTGHHLINKQTKYPITMYQQMRHSWVKYIIWQKENLFLFVRTAERDVKYRNPTVNTKIWMKLPLMRIELQSNNLTQLFKN